jgi:ribosomal protein S18 acetylase RimI-like enzyme
MGDHVPVAEADWTLRAASAEDRDFVFELNRTTMRSYVDATWGWDDDEQVVFFGAHFDPERCEIIQAENEEIGVLAVEERADEIYLAEIQLLPQWQGRGIGSAIIGSLLERGATAGKPVTLRVLHSNPRAAELYESLGFTAFRTIETHTYMRADPSRPTD